MHKISSVLSCIILCEILYTWILTPQQISPDPSEDVEKYSEMCGAFKAQFVAES